MNKIRSSLDKVVQDIPDGASIMIGGFGAAGYPANLVHAVIKHGARDLTVICNAFTELMELVEAGLVRKIISAYPQPQRKYMPVCQVEIQYRAGTLEIEVVPQGTLCERIQSAGIGIPAFYCAVGAGTDLEKGKEVRVFGNKRCVLEHALSADFALIKGWKADQYGNVVYRMAARNINPIMAKAARTTIVEVEHTVELGELEPDRIHTPGIFVDRVVRCDRISREFVAPYFVGQTKYLTRSPS